MKSSNISDDDLDKEIKRTFEYVTKNIDISDNMLENINFKLNGGNIMKRKFKKITIAIAAMVLSATAVTGIIAASGVKSWTGHSSNLTEKAEFPDKDTLKDECGYDIKYIKEFDNGFVFSKYNIGESKGLDENGNAIIEEKEVHIDYLKDKGTEAEKRLFFNAERRPDYLYESSYNVKSVDYKDSKINYSEYIYKAFPPNFEEKKASDEDKKKAEELMAEVRKTYPEAEDITKLYSYLTEEDIAAYKNNQLMLAYGSSEIETNYMQSASWYDNGIAYTLMNFSNDIPDDEFIDMVKKVIDSE